MASIVRWFSFFLQPDHQNKHFWWRARPIHLVKMLLSPPYNSTPLMADNSKFHQQMIASGRLKLRHSNHKTPAAPPAGTPDIRATSQNLLIRKPSPLVFRASWQVSARIFNRSQLS
jgi:hypothetical protein